MKFSWTVGDSQYEHTLEPGLYRLEIATRPVDDMKLVNAAFPQPAPLEEFIHIGAVPENDHSDVRYMHSLGFGDSFPQLQEDGTVGLPMASSAYVVFHTATNKYASNIETIDITSYEEPRMWHLEGNPEAELTPLSSLDGAVSLFVMRVR